MPRRYLLAAGATAALLAGCAGGPTPTDSREAPAPVASATAVSDESRRLRELVDAYFEDYLLLNPLAATSIGDSRYDDRFEISISPDWRARAERTEFDYLAKLRQIDKSALAGQDLLTYQVFESARERELAGFEFPGHLIPLNQFYSVPNTFAQLGSGNGQQPFKSPEDYDKFLRRLDGFVAWTDQAIVNMRLGLARGYTLPKVLTERTLPQLEAHVVARPEDSVYWGPIRNMPPSISAVDRERITVAYRGAIEGKVVPSYRRLHDFMRDEYLPHCRTTDGMGALPDGDRWYRYRVRQVTTTDLTPAQIHEIGLAEVKRIHGEMGAVMERVGFKGSLDEFFRFLNNDPQFVWPSAEALIDGYVAIKNRVDPQLPKLFGVLPKADYQVRAVEPFREKSAAGGSYQAANEDGSRPGVFYANTYDLKARPKWAMEALSLHEGNPGHHFQISVAREQKELPRFRRFGGYTAYSEGWALYAESLGPDLGMYQDPYQYFGRLEGELFRAIRLVVDTGLHSKGWTREQVLAYKLGQLRISELRARAERELGPRFDIRRFHDAILVDGPLPLDVLEGKLDRWIASEKGG